MRCRLEIENLAAEDLKAVVREGVAEAIQPLLVQIEKLNRQFLAARPVITHKEAPAYFAGEVQPRAIIRYIKEEGLPAVKRGRLWFIDVAQLMDWQMGRTAGPLKPTQPVPGRRDQAA